MCYAAVREAIKELDLSKAPMYEAYFDTIRPKTKEDIFRRGLFAFASVHTGWYANVKLYAKLWDLEWMHDQEMLRARIIESRAGLVNTRLKAISEYTAAYWQFPGLLDRKPHEPWHVYRDRIMGFLYGLGPAKAAFLIELVHMQDSDIVCMDTHMLQLYGVKTSEVGLVRPVDLARFETHWDITCHSLGVKPVVARWLYWDKKQRKEDSRYWSHVLEGKPAFMVEQMELFTGEDKTYE